MECNFAVDKASPRVAFFTPDGSSKSVPGAFTKTKKRRPKAPEIHLNRGAKPGELNKPVERW